MKKSKLLVLTLITALLLAFTGCGANNIPAITETAETFLQAADDADMDKIRETCTESAIAQMGLKPLDATYNADSYFAGMGLDKSSFTEDAQNAVAEYGKYYADTLIQGYSIGEVTEKNGVGSVTATITTYSKETLQELVGDDFKAALTTLINEYTDENLNDLSSIYLNEGEEAMTIKIFNDIMTDIMKTLKQTLDGLETVETTVTLTVEKVDGNWMVTGATVVE